MGFELYNGVKIAPVGYGTYLSTDANGYLTIKDALDTGYRYIDTAMMYQNEEAVGRAIKESGISRDSIFIASKVWPTMLGEDLTRKSFEDSCAKIGTDYLDLFLIHWPKKSPEDTEWAANAAASWKVMEELYEAGRVRAIGLSNFLPHHIAELSKTANIRPMIDQLELHAGYMQEYTLRYLDKEGILPQAWSPLGRGALLSNGKIGSLADKYGKTPAQVLLRFLLERGVPVIPKASSVSRMKENLDILDFSLSKEEVSYLSCMAQEGYSGEHPDEVSFG